MKAVSHVSSNDRMSWLQLNSPLGRPFFYNLLDKGQATLLDNWISETSSKNMIGETSISAIGILLGLVLGNNIRRVVQCGHYAGFSLLVLSMVMKNSRHGGRIVSFDIDQAVTRFAQSFIDKGELNDTAKLFIMDSADSFCVTSALSEMHNEPPQLVFIDSSHQYRHTIEELTLWASAVQPGGFLVMHDASRMASEFDRNDLGGVRQALDEWLPQHPEVSSIIIDPDSDLQNRLTYIDPCGLALLHVKRPRSLSVGVATKRRLISDPNFQHSDNWLLGEGWSFTQGRVSHTPGISSSASCFSPVVGGERYKVEVELANVTSGGVHPAAGSGELMNFMSKNGKHSTIIKSGSDNAFIGLLASADFDGDIISFNAEPLVSG